MERQDVGEVRVACERIKAYNLRRKAKLSKASFGECRAGRNIKITSCPPQSFLTKKFPTATTCGSER